VETIAETARLILREVESSDIEALARIFADPRVMYFGPGVRTRDETAEWIEAMRGRYVARGRGLWGVVSKADAALVGVCGLMEQVVEERERVEVGYRMARECQGRGFATEAARAARDHAFARWDLDNVISIIEPGNVASIRVAEKNGMTVERLIEMWNRPVRIYAVRRERAAAASGGHAAVGRPYQKR
jgi:ribosomal-protein-alanine N-acetyltransferase